MYQQLTGGPEVTLSTFEGAFVEREGGVMCQLHESLLDQNEIQKGSLAQLEEIKEYIASHDIEKEKTKELLSQHKKDREEYLNALKKKDRLADYCPGDLPHDSMLVVRTQALIDLQERLSQQESGKEMPLEPRIERTYLNIIGALLEFVTGTFKDEKFSSETQLREFIAEKFDDLRGVAPRTLADKFALAKKALKGELD